MYPVVYLPDDAGELSEQLGTKFKFWAHLPDGQQVLFKEGRPGTGENWAEVAASKLADLFGIPQCLSEIISFSDRAFAASVGLRPIAGTPRLLC